MDYLLRKHPVRIPPLALATDDHTLNMLPISYPTGQQTNILELIHDAFQPLSYWDNFMPRNQYTGVAIDTHIYQMFTDQVCSPPMSLDAFNQHPLMKILSPQEVSLSETGHIQSACGNAGTLSNFDKNQLYTIVGEWTPAMTDCAKYLNGRGVGARYDGSISPGAPVYGSCIGQTGSGSTFSQDYKTFLRQMWEAQVS